MKKIYLSILLIIFPSIALANPESSTNIDINQVLFLTDSTYGYGGSEITKFHTPFIQAMKKQDSINAIKIIDQFQKEGGNGLYANTSISTEHRQLLPKFILSQKGYKGGILMLGVDGLQDLDVSSFYLSFIRYKKVNNQDRLYIYNIPLAPKNSSQFKSYTALYADGTLEANAKIRGDLTASFKRGKFNNKNVNAIYQDLIKSIK